MFKVIGLFWRFSIALWLLYPLTAKAAAISAKSGVSRESSPWPPLLDVLNQSPKGKAVPYDPPISVDLLALYKKEVKEIDEAWEARPKPSKDSKGAEAKRRENVYFHERILERNARTLAPWLKPMASAKDLTLLGQQILEKVRKNPVANLEATQAYDPTGQLGFCFGRALLVHYHLLEAGIAQEDIAKVFSAGELRVGHKIWNFHVAVMVRDPKHGSLVIDPIHEKPMPLSEWRAKTAAFDMKGTLSRARFYVTDARKFLPSFGAYSRDQLENEYLKAYFTDLALSLKKAG